MAHDKQKINFAANLFTGKALTWWKHRIIHQNIQYTYFDDLMDDIHKHFVDVDLINKLRDRLDALQQGNGSVQSYISKFKEL